MKKLLKTLPIIFACALILSQIPMVLPSPALAFQASSDNSSAANGLSYNWAGYVANSGTYTSVAATWNVPTITPNTSQTTQSDAEWIGIGGISSHDLIQAGTLALTNSGDIHYEAWIEMLPAAPIQLPITIAAGDSVSVSINETSSNVFAITFKDNTTGQSCTTTQTYTSSLSSAEWIVEMPTDATNQAFIPLDTFSQINFSNGTTVENNTTETIAQSGAQQLNMMNTNNQALVATSGLSGYGENFSVSRTNVPVTSNQNTATGYRRRISIPIPEMPNGAESGFVITITPQGFVVQQSYSYNRRHHFR